MRKLKIIILGTRGVPNNHGGFEQFAEYFSLYMVNKGHDVSVFNTHSHPYQLKEWNGVKIIHKKDPENSIGTVGQFIYDLNCILHCRKEHFDVILQLGYTSSSVWSKLMPKTSLIITNMDGLEWKRSKYKKPVRIFLKFAESLAIHNSDFLISDSLGIQKYIKDTYSKESTYIAYGADVFSNPCKTVLDKYDVTAGKYNMLIARLEPENNIEVILDGVSSAKTKNIFLVIGKFDTNKFGRYLKEKYKNHKHIKFLGGVYNLDHLNNLRFYSKLYFHGHSVGGTNPSLLEAMASGAFIVANDNIFNKSILKYNALYFKCKEEVTSIIDDASVYDIHKETFNILNLKQIKTSFSWDLINRQYETFLLSKFDQDDC